MVKKEEIDEVAAALRRKAPRIKTSDLLSTGSAVLNCLITGNPFGGYLRGTFTHIIGDSECGKTWYALMALAEACLNKNFDNYRYIYDPTENGALMNLRKYFGDAVADRIESPNSNPDGTPRPSYRIEEVFYYLADLLDAGEPFFCIVDSLDGLSCKADDDHFTDLKTAFEKDPDAETKGSYGMGKAYAISQGLKRVVPGLQETGSILVLISQTRDNVGATAKFSPKVYAGGKALRFYCRLQLWFTLGGKLKKTYRGNEYEVGAVSKIAIKKNSINGRHGTVEVPFYTDYGVDDTGSCIDFLLSSKYWRPAKGSSIIPAEELGFTGTRDKLIEHIEAGLLEPQLRKLVGKAWAEIEAAVAVPRKPRYG